MDRALWVLLWLRLRAWARRIGCSLRTVRGVLLATLGGLVFVPWLLSLTLASRASGGTPPAQINRYGPWFLLGYCVLTALTSAGDRALAFTPAEVAFLFAGPFGRRQLLAYKMVGAFLVSCASAAVFSFLVRLRGVPRLSTFVGMAFGFLLLQLFSMLVSLLGMAMGERLFSRRRQLFAAVAFGLVAAALLSGARAGLGHDPAALVVRVENSPAVRGLLTPFRWFVRAYTAETLWPDLALWGGLALLVDVVLAVAVIAMDVFYLESAASAGERVYRRLQRLRRGVPAAGVLETSSARWPMPLLPWWGGIGPIAWRQLQTAVRQPWALAMAFVLVLIVGGIAFRSSAEIGPAVAVMLLVTGLFITPLVPFDFRGDVERIDVLKALPVPSWSLTVGQLLAPVAVVSVLQCLAAGLAEVVLQKPLPNLWTAVAFSGPVNFLLLGMDNLFFLWFPTRSPTPAPGDLQAVGRQALITLGKAAGLGLAALVVVCSVTAAELVTQWAGVEGYPLSVAAAWLALAMFAVALVPLIALAFRRFDPARDTPP